MRFTGHLARNRYASMVLYTLIPPQKVFDLAEVLASRMRVLTEGRMWMGAHMRRGDCKHRFFPIPFKQRVTLLQSYGWGGWRTRSLRRTSSA